MLGGCLRFATSIYPEDVLEPGKGYFYGRFSTDPGFSLASTRMGVVITSVDKKHEIGLSFEPTLDPYAVAVDPGDYQATHIVFRGGGGSDQLKPFPEELSSRVIHVEAGKAYYIGDFDGTMKTTFLVLFIASRWRIGQIANEFAGTTAKLDALLPQMKNMPKVDVFGDLLVTAFSSTAVPKEAPKKEVSNSPAPLDGSGTL